MPVLVVGIGGDPVLTKSARSGKPCFDVLQRFFFFGKEKMPYNDALFSDKHTMFKESMNLVFRDFCSRMRPGSSCVFLDAITSHTVRALKGLNIKRFVANTDMAVVEELKKHKDVTAVCGDIVRCLREDWKDIAFEAAYFDGCNSSPEKIITTLDAFFSRQFDAHVPILVGFTLLGRDRGARSHLDRQGVVYKYLNQMQLSLRRKFTRVHDAPLYYDVDWLDRGVATEFVQFECAPPLNLEGSSDPAPIVPVEEKRPAESKRNTRGICCICKSRLHNNSTVCLAPVCVKRKHALENARSMRKRRKEQKRSLFQKPKAAQTKTLLAFFGITRGAATP